MANRRKWPLAKASGLWATCQDCGKRGYKSRKAANAAGRRMPGAALNAYRCSAAGPDAEMAWHLGHLPRPVVAGRWVRGELGLSAARPAHRHDGGWCPDCGLPTTPAAVPATEQELAVTVARIAARKAAGG